MIDSQQVLSILEAALLDEGASPVDYATGEPLLVDRQAHRARARDHALWMVKEAQDFPDYEKQLRWIGFVQGILWMLGAATIDDLRDTIRTAQQ